MNGTETEDGIEEILKEGHVMVVSFSQHYDGNSSAPKKRAYSVLGQKLKEKR